MRTILSYLSGDSKIVKKDAENSGMETAPSEPAAAEPQAANGN